MWCAADEAENQGTDRRLAQARLEISAGQVRSGAYGDLYHPAGDAQGAAEHVFVQGSRLASRLGAARRCFTIAELGFGAGLNFLTVRRLWRRIRRAGARLVYIGVDSRPLETGEMRAAHRALGISARQTEWLVGMMPPRWAGWHFADCGDGIDLVLAYQEAWTALEGARFVVDAWFLDGFSPACNPDMWSAALMREVARLTRPGGTAATYSSAGEVRRNLAAAGFAVSARAGHAGKRENLVSSMPGKPVAASPPRSAAVFGAGIAGASVARALTRRGVEVVLIDADGADLRGASGNRNALLTPHVTAGMGATAALTNACFAHAYRLAVRMGAARHSCALLLAHSEAAQKRRERLLLHEWPDALLRAVDRCEASRLAGIPVPTAGIQYPAAAMVDGAAFVRAIIGGVKVRSGFFAAHAGLGWQTGRCRKNTQRNGQVQVLCLGQGLAAAVRGMPLTERPGAVASFAASAASAKLEMPLLFGGYVTPCDGRRKHHLGMQTRACQSDDGVRAAFAKMSAKLPDSIAACAGSLADITWSATRVSAPDYLPVAGELEVGEGQPPVYLLGALGSRGLTTAPLLGEVVAAQICGESAPLPAALLDAISPNRFRFA